MTDISSLYKTHLDVPPVLQNIFSLLKMNKNYRLKYQKNLRGKTTFKNVKEYQLSFLPLFQNEQYSQLQDDKMNYAKQLEKQLMIPLFYKIRIIEKNQGFFVFDAQEQRQFPGKAYINEIKWKYRHYKEYLQFQLSSCYFVSMHFQFKSNQWKSTLAYMIKNKNNSNQAKIYIPKSTLLSECLLSKNIKTKMRYEDEDEAEDNEYWKGNIFIYLQPLQNISSYQNEQSAIIQLANYKYQDQILGQIKHLYIEKKQLYDQDQVKNYCEENEAFSRLLNIHQRDAIQDSLNYQNKFTLIKGPPGTGKTQTTIGILSLIFRLEFKKDSVVLLLGRTNTVVNDLVRRIRQNIKDENSIINFDNKLIEKQFKPKIMRSGRADKCETDVFDCSVEICAQIIFFKKNYKQLSSQCIKYVKQNFSKPQKHLIGFLDHIDCLKDKSLSELEQIGNYYKEMHYLLQNKQEEYENIILALLSDCNILVSTINSVAHQSINKFLSKRNIDICIIDEAPTALEPTMLIPITAYQDIQKFVLLGDINQLNPITKAKESKDYSYNRSMYERLSSIIYPIPLLMQYRQLKNLAQITSEVFYKGKLKNGLTEDQENMPNYLENVIDIKNNSLIFFTEDGKEEKEDTSTYNQLEARQILNLIKYLTKQLTTTYQIDTTNNFKQKPISVISAYKEQYRRLKKELKQQKLDKFAEIDTIDSFQGKENDIVIISLVKSNKIGFLTDKKRTNVALSRAKYAQYIFGTESCLKWNLNNWSKLIKIFKRNNCIRNYKLKDLDNAHYFRDVLLNTDDTQ